MINLNKLMRLILITSLILIIARQRTFRWQPRGVTYRRYLWYAVINVLGDYDSFRRYTRFTPDVFMHYYYQLIVDDLNMSQAHYLLPDADEHRHRQRAISKISRAIRCSMFFAGWNRSSLVFIFQQSYSTVSRDCIFISRVIVKKLYNKYIYSPLPGTREYNDWVGAGVFAPYFPTTIYAGDVMKISIPRPIMNQRDFYDGHHHEHNVGYFITVNGWGQPCYALGPASGRNQDGTLIFRYFPPPMLTAYTGLMVYTYFQLFFNYHQSESNLLHCVAIAMDYNKKSNSRYCLWINIMKSDGISL
eukprot:227795_1